MGYCPVALTVIGTVRGTLLRLVVSLTTTVKSKSDCRHGVMGQVKAGKFSVIVSAARGLPKLPLETVIVRPSSRRLVMTKRMALALASV